MPQMKGTECAAVGPSGLERETDKETPTQRPGHKKKVESTHDRTYMRGRYEIGTTHKLVVLS